jgi:hypothetical protein
MEIPSVDFDLARLPAVITGALGPSLSRLNGLMLVVVVSKDCTWAEAAEAKAVARTSAKNASKKVLFISFGGSPLGSFR